MLFNDGDDDENDSRVSVTIIPPLLIAASDMSDAERRAIWYQPQEYDAQQHTARNIALAIRRREPCDPRGNPTTYSNVLARVYTSCLSTRMNGPTKQDMDKLSHWTRVAHSRRGLEKMSLPEISKLRKQCKDKVVQAVLEAQDCLLDNATSYEERADVIRRQCERRSRSASLFAAAMGQADAKAAEGEYSAQRKMRFGQTQQPVDSSTMGSQFPSAAASQQQPKSIHNMHLLQQMQLQQQRQLQQQIQQQQQMSGGSSDVYFDSRRNNSPESKRKSSLDESGSDRTQSTVSTTGSGSSSSLEYNSTASAVGTNGGYHMSTEPAVSETACSY